MIRLRRRRRWHDPTHGRIDRDIQEYVEAMRPTSLGQRVAIENTLQEQRVAMVVTSPVVPPGTAIIGALGLGARLYEPAPRRRWRLTFAPYDLWVGAYHDREFGTWYFCPLPCVLITWDRQQPRRRAS